MKTKAIAALIALFLAFNLSLHAGQDRPNIVWLVTEDNSIHYLKLYDEGGAAMPTVEKLASEGIVFNNAFSNAPVCSAARSTIISGCYGPRAFSHFHRRSVLVPMPDGLKMFPTYLREAGYYTTNCSKEDYNFIKTEGVWDASSGKASYRNRKPGQPFFHVQNFGTTHEGRLHFSEKQYRNEKTTTDPETVSIFPVHPDTHLFKYTNAKYRDLHMKVDAEMGKFVKQLEEDGVLDDTIIFYYGDHGGVLPGSKGYIYERGVHVPMVVRIPEKWKHLAPFDKAQGRPIATGNRVDGFVQFIDLGPTVLNLAGIEVPKLVDGKPFLGKGVELAELNSRDTAFCYADRFDEKYDFVRTLRKGKYKYMRNYQPFNFDGLQNNYRYKMLAYEEWRDLYEAGKLTPEQAQFFEPRPAEALFDVEADPFETVNLAGKRKYREKLVEMRKAMKEQVRALPDLSFIPEPVLYTDAAKNPVAYGQKHKKRISQLANVADLNLRPFKNATEPLDKALSSNDALKRYWGLVICSSFGKEAAAYADKARELAKSDPDNLVRMRAAEFLGLIGAEDPRPVLIECMKNAKNDEEAAFILNTVTLLHDSNPGYKFTMDRSWVPADWFDKDRSNMIWRYEYLESN
ncbi:MAG: sulfatase-like hydrolase/transferase [Puniceicoccaceae bacterium]